MYPKYFRLCHAKYFPIYPSNERAISFVQQQNKFLLRKKISITYYESFNSVVCCVCNLTKNKHSKKRVESIWRVTIEFQ